MNPFRLPLLVLAAPLLLSACGSSVDEPVHLRQSSGVHSFVVAPTAQGLIEPRRSYTIARTAAGFSVSDKFSGVVTLSVPSDARVRFADTSIALDLDGVAGKAYRLYRAAYGRAPDIAGLSYWIAAMDAGTPFETVAIAFSKSPEFKALYGENPAHAELVNGLYQNVMRRIGDAAGVAFWINLLNQKRATYAQVLVGFSESAENKQALLATTQFGIAYFEPGIGYMPTATAGSYLGYVEQAPVANAAEARVRFNEQGAQGLAYVGNFASDDPAWNIDLYARNSPIARFSYEVVNAWGVSAAARLATLEQWGAKGYLYKSTSVFGFDKLTPYDVLVKGNGASTTYSYRLESEAFTISTVNQHGLQGYAYRGHLYISGKGYALYAKDMKSDAIYTYARADLLNFDSGLMTQLNALGSQGYAYLGAYVDGDDPAALYVHSSISPSPFSYTAEPRVSASAPAAVAAFNRAAFNGKAYLGNVAGAGSYLTIFYKGDWIVEPSLGVTFP